jgi:hypothetical protein
LVKAPSLFISAFTLTQIIVGLIGFIVFVSLVYLIRKMFTDDTPPERPLSRRSFLLFSGLCFLLTYLLDVYNGSSFINFRSAANNHYNIGKSLVRELYKDARIYYKNYAPVESIVNFSVRSKKLPPSYSIIQDTSTSRQLVIILESWGLPKNQSIRSSFQQKLESIFAKKYTVKFDSTLSIGGTSQAEARELLNKSGEAYYSVVQHEKMLDQGLVHAKKLQGYKVFSRQGFSGFHSNGFKFRKLIGFEDVKEYSYYRDSLRFPEVYFNHYKSVDDRMVIADAMQQFKNSNKAFGYILTINTHLPFELPIDEKRKNTYEVVHSNYRKYFPTDESFDQYYLILSQLEEVARLIIENNIQKVVLVGDHPPPFLKKIEREVCSAKFVPDLIISSNSHNELSQ